MVPVGEKMFLMLLVTQVRLFMDCEEYHRVDFSRSPRPLTFEAGSGIFVGNGGATGLTRFVVSLLFLSSRLHHGLQLQLCRSVSFLLSRAITHLDFFLPSIQGGNNSICRWLADKKRDE